MNDRENETVASEVSLIGSTYITAVRSLGTLLY
jgi:hypothetical protein